MFSRIPIPNVEWKEENMRYMLCGFPLVGAVIGLLFWVWIWLCGVVGFGPFIKAAGLTFIPVFISGGIHLEGFLDTSDALASHGDVEKKRRIMKDSHIGAFAAIALGLYFLLYYAFSLELQISLRTLTLISLSFVLSRSTSGLTVIFFPSSKNEGLFRSFKDTADKRAAAVILMFFALLCMTLMLFYLPLAALAMLLMLSIALLSLCVISRSQFGGMSGDLAGWFLCLAELLMLIGLTTILKLMY